MSSTRIILGSLIAASVRHGIFTIALPWLILYQTAGMEELGFDSGYPAAGSVLILLGAALYIRAFAERLRMTAMVSASSGSFEENGAKDQRPVWSEGIHGWSRNPLQLGVVVILFGESLAFESLLLLVYAALYWAWTTLFLIFAEEPVLRRTLGEEYTAYCRHVPRWFLRIRFRKSA